jgi:hypothetical protein
MARRLLLIQVGEHHLKPRICLFTALTFTGVGLLYASISTDFDKSADFGKYHTFSWIGARAGDDLWVGRIKQDVNEALTSHGWSMVESGGDCGVSAFGSTKKVQSLNTFYDGMGGGWGWRSRWGGAWGGGMMDATTTVENTPVGTLVVDIFDQSTKKLIWRGNSSEALSDKPDKNDKKLEKDVTEMFKKFPPTAKE